MENAGARVLPGRVRPSRQLTASLAVTAALAAVVGCGEGGTGKDRAPSGGSPAGPGPAAPGPAGGAPVGTIDVSETEFTLHPPDPKLGKPGIVEIRAKNDGKVPHAIAVEGPAGRIASEEIPPGEQAVLRADLSKQGTFTWYCPVDDHRQKGMEGKITVAAAGPGAQPPADEGEGESDSGPSGY